MAAWQHADRARASRDATLWEHWEQLRAAQEEAARRTATVLHNDLAPTLATVKLELQMFLMKHPHADGRRMVETLSHAIDRARDLSREIHPAVVDHLGLPAALRALSGRLAEANGWVLTLDTPESMNLPGRTAALLYRIGQELLYNVTKHAGARRVDMILADGRRGLHLVVRDDGKGCNPATVRPGIGWISLRERVSALGGRCRMTPRKNRGLEVCVWIPHP